jgi:hypothetical protein
MTNVGLGKGVSGSRCSYQLTWGSPRTGMWVRSAAYLAVPEEFQKLPFNFRSTNFKTTPRLSIKRHCTATTLKQGSIAWFRWDMNWLHNNLNTVFQTRALPKVAAIKKIRTINHGQTSANRTKPAEVFNSRSGCSHSVRFHPNEPKQPSLKLITWPKPI